LYVIKNSFTIHAYEIVTSKHYNYVPLDLDQMVEFFRKIHTLILLLTSIACAYVVVC